MKATRAIPLFLILGFAAPPSGWAVQSVQAYLGTNVAEMRSNNSQWAFVDVFRGAREWVPQLVNGGPWDTGQDLDLTPEGWPLLAPGQAAGTLMLDELKGVYPGGIYTCLFEGTGSIEFGFDAFTINESGGRIVVLVRPSDLGIYLKVTASDPNDPVRNIRLVLPGFESNYQTQVFHPLFLERLQGYGCLRFMDFQYTNNSINSNWAERATPNYYSQATPKGAALEFMVELCNRLGTDAWFCMPHLADDEYVREFAEQVRDTLDPQLHVYIEHSNEVWNTNFEQTTFASNQGLALGFSTDPKIAALRYHAYRSVQIFGIWEAAFGSTDRFVRVLASQAVNTGAAREVMDFQDAYLSADVYAIAPYFGNELGSVDNAGNTVQMTVDEILDACEADVADVGATIDQNLVETQARGLDLVAYEAGQHLVGRGVWMNNQVLNDLFFAANRHERMEAIYELYLDLWRSRGGRQLMAYTFVKRFNEHGSWGALEHLDQPLEEAPKYRALRRALTAELCEPPSPYCISAPNSVGPGATIGSEGSASVMLEDLRLTATGLPPGEIGLFFYGPRQVQIPLGDGFLCVAAGGGVGLYRLFPPLSSDGNGDVGLTVDFSRFEGSPGEVQAGSTWNFQYIYRDSSSGSSAFNTSDALSVEFCP